MLKNNEPQEQLEFLKREEVRTMAKDIAQLREEEAKKERDRITKIKPEEPKKEAQAPTRIPQPQPIPPSLMPHIEGQKPVFLKAKTRSEKIIIRIMVIGILLFLVLNGLAFGYWYLTRKQVVGTPSPQPLPEAMAGEAEPGNGNQVSPERNLVSPTPTAFFEAPQQELLLGNSRELLPELQALLASPPSLGFLNIVVKTQLGILSAQEFLEKAEIAMPLTLQKKLTENIMLFSYHQDNKKRLGVVFELKDTEGISAQLQSWEQTLEQDIKPLWEIVGQKGSAYTPFFRQTTYLNNLVRFQTFSVIDFGIVYSVVGTKIILTTSFESLTRAVDLLAQSGQ